MVYQNWWKFAAVALLLYTFLAGLLVPLKPGIVKVDPGSAEAGGELELEVTGYNTRWERDSLRAWLKYDDAHALGATVQNVESRSLMLEFEIPAILPDEASVVPLSLIVDHPATGPTVLPDAVFVRAQNALEGALPAAWSRNPVEALHFRKDFAYPYRNLLAETIRNQYFHVPLWFAMIIVFAFSVVKSVLNLNQWQARREQEILALNATGLLFGTLGLATGMLWANYTWGTWWNWDIKQTMALIAVMIYLAFFILRGSVPDRRQKARVANVYNVFAFIMLIPLLFVIPRMTDSLHPGAGGNPAFGGDDLDNTMRAVFYPAVVGWTLLAMWIASLWARYLILRESRRWKGLSI